jgi:hypothetical protein
MAKTTPSGVIKHELFNRCGKCGGSGSLDTGGGGSPPGSADCPACGASGYLFRGYIFSLEKIFPAYLVFEEFDDTEYAGLDDDSKLELSILLGAGHVDLNTGQRGRTRLWAIFGAGSTTVANLTTLSA